MAAPYCAANFEKQPNVVASWQALKKSADNYDQTEFIEKGGWIALPKAKSISSDTTDAVANACATRLMALKELNGVMLGSVKG